MFNNTQENSFTEVFLSLVVYKVDTWGRNRINFVIGIRCYHFFYSQTISGYGDLIIY